jgi:hypothetical protein
MEFVIELDELACGATKRKVVCRGWERKRPQSAQARHQYPSRASGAEAAPKTKSEPRHFRESPIPT